MVPNAFLLLTPDQAAYLALGMCGLSLMLVALHVQRRFNRASAVLTSLNREWEDAQSRFFSIAEVAQQRINEIEPLEAPPTRWQEDREIGFDLRNQVASMARRGMAPADIARTSGMTEAEVEVLIGMTRLGKK